MIGNFTVTIHGDAYAQYQKINHAICAMQQHPIAHIRPSAQYKNIFNKHHGNLYLWSWWSKDSHRNYWIKINPDSNESCWGVW